MVSRTFSAMVASEASRSPDRLGTRGDPLRIVASRVLSFSSLAIPSLSSPSPFPLLPLVCPYPFPSAFPLRLFFLFIHSLFLSFTFSFPLSCRPALLANAGSGLIDRHSIVTGTSHRGADTTSSTIQGQARHAIQWPTRRGFAHSVTCGLPAARGLSGLLRTYSSPNRRTAASGPTGSSFPANRTITP